MRNVRVAVLTVAVFAGAVTAAAALLPKVSFATRLTSLRAVTAPVPPMLAFVACLLVLGRLRRGARLNEIGLAYSLGTLALSGLASVTVPLLMEGYWPDLSVWAALAGTVIGAALFALAAFVPRRRLRHPGLALAMGGAVVTMILFLTAVLAAAFATRLLPVPAAVTAPGAPAVLDLYAEATLRTAEVIVAASYGLATAGLLRRSAQCHDELSGWLAISAVLAVAAHVNYFVHPTFYLQFVSLGDVFLLSCYTVLLGGLARESWCDWRSAPEEAVLAERQRIGTRPARRAGPGTSLLGPMRHRATSAAVGLWTLPYQVGERR